MSSRAVDVLPSNELFNAASELNEDLGINLYETDNRNYDTQLGSFRQIDKLAAKFVFWSPYQFGYNNPVSNNDPTGLETITQDQINQMLNSPFGGHWDSKNGLNVFETRGEMIGYANSHGFGKYVSYIYSIDGGGGAGGGGGGGTIVTKEQRWKYATADGKYAFYTPNYHANPYNDGQNVYYFQGAEEITMTYEVKVNTESTDNTPLLMFGLEAVDLTDEALGLAETLATLDRNVIRQSIQLVAKDGIKMLKALGPVAAAASVLKSGIALYEKKITGSHVVHNTIMTGVAFLGPVGLGISLAWGAIDLMFGDEIDQWLKTNIDDNLIRMHPLMHNHR